MMKNLTLRLDETVLKNARRKAVEADQSLSRWVGGLIRQSTESTATLARGKRRAIARMKRGFSLGKKTLDRDSLHGRQ